MEERNNNLIVMGLAHHGKVNNNLVKIFVKLNLPLKPEEYSTETKPSRDNRKTARPLKAQSIFINEHFYSRGGLEIIFVGTEAQS